MNVAEAALFVTFCAEYDFDIDLCDGRHCIDAKSLMGVMAIGLGKECRVKCYTSDRNFSIFKRNLEEIGIPTIVD